MLTDGLSGVAVSSRLQGWPLKYMSALVPQLYCCGQLPSSIPRPCLGRHQHLAGVVFLRPRYAGVLRQLLPEMFS